MLTSAVLRWPLLTFWWPPAGCRYPGELIWAQVDAPGQPLSADALVILCFVVWRNEQLVVPVNSTLGLLLRPRANRDGTEESNVPLQQAVSGGRYPKSRCLYPDTAAAICRPGFVALLMWCCGSEMAQQCSGMGVRRRYSRRDQWGYVISVAEVVRRWCGVGGGGVAGSVGHCQYNPANGVRYPRTDSQGSRPTISRQSEGVRHFRDVVRSSGGSAGALHRATRRVSGVSADLQSRTA